jgi:polar amino acid transport system substrate-binding protein
MNRSRITLAAGLLTIGALLTTACGKSSKSTTDAAVKVDKASAALLPKSVADTGTLTVALDATYAPDEFIDTDGKTIIGFDADLSNAIAGTLGLKATLSNATFDTIIPGIVSGKFDLGASSFTDTKEREQQVDFVTYFTAGEGYYVPANSTLVLDGLESLCGHKVAVEKGTTEETDANTQNDACTKAGKPGVTVLSFDDQNAANLAVSSGRAEVGFLDSQIAAYVASTSKGQFKTSGKPFATAPYGLAVAKNGIGPAVLSALKVLIADGTYGKFLAKWGLTDGAITDPVINGAAS